MEKLNDKKCVPCQGGIPPMAEEEIKKYSSQIKADWEILPARNASHSDAGGDPSFEVKDDGLGKKLHKDFKFKDFKEAMNFVNKVAELAEQEQHHPNIAVDYNKVDITLWTHKITGLHENDFILASKIDNL